MDTTIIELCDQIKQQMASLGIQRFILSNDFAEGNVHFESEDFEDCRGDFDAEARLYYITGDNGVDSFAIVYGLSVEDDQLSFHVIKGTEGEDGTEYNDDTKSYSLDEIFEEMQDYEEFDVEAMLKIYLNLLKGEFYGDEVKFTVD